MPALFHVAISIAVSAANTGLYRGTRLESNREKRRKMKKQKKLTKHDWNFGNVPDAELLACCYWEFARESASIRGAVDIIKTAYANQGIARPESAEREAFRSVADKAFGLLHSTGFDCSFWTELPFPKTWQSADKTKREKWARVLPKIPTPVKFPPFAVANDLCIAGALYGEATPCRTSSCRS